MFVQLLCVHTIVAETVIVTTGVGHFISVVVIRKHTFIMNIISQ